MKKFGLLLVVAVSLSCFGQLVRPTVYVEPQQGFETYLAAAISKKNVPVDSCHRPDYVNSPLRDCSPFP